MIILNLWLFDILVTFIPGHIVTAYVVLFQWALFRVLSIFPSVLMLIAHCTMFATLSSKMNK